MGMEGIISFLSRVYHFGMRQAKNHVEPGRSAVEPLSSEARALQRKLHQTIKRVSDDFAQRWHFNTSISAIMELVNDLYGAEEAIASGKVPAALVREIDRNLILLLAPLAPYLAHELWEATGEKASLLRDNWPQYDPALAKEDEIEIVVQVNGKV